MKLFLKGMRNSWKWGTSNTIIATVITHLNSISVGMCQGYSAILLPQLAAGSRSFYSDDNQLISQFIVTAEEASWIASLGVLSNPFGALLSGILMDTCGRKSTIMYTTFPFLFGWTVIALSEDMYSLCVGRCITGLAIGMASSCYVYVAEISLPSSRGFLSSFGPVFVSLGVLIVYCLGYFTSWKIIALVCASMALISLFAVQYIPETPSWLVANNEINRAAKSLEWFHNNPTAVDRELSDILEVIKVSKNMQPRNYKEFFMKCARPEVWKPFLILIGFFILQELSGIYIVLYYAVDFFSRAGSSMNNYIASILVGILRFVVCIFGSLCIQRFQRKSLSSLSALLMSFTMALAAIYEHWYSSFDTADRPYVWIPLVCILANVSASTLGMLQIPWLMIGELFPLSVRGIMGGVVSSLAYIFIFMTVKLYPNLLRILDMDGIMLLFACASLVAAMYSLALVPETKDKTLSQVERSFTKSNNSSSTEKLQDCYPSNQNIPSISIVVENKQI